MDPDVAEFFPDGDSANDALRSLIPIIKKREKRAAEQGHWDGLEKAGAHLLFPAVIKNLV